MHDVVRLRFLTNGLGGNEIAALEIRDSLVAAGARVEIDIATPNPRLQDYLVLKGFPFQEWQAVAPLDTRTIHVASSYLNALRLLPIKTLRSPLTYIYTPFWGFEWVPYVTSRRLRKKICRLSMAALALETRLIAPFDNFRSKAFDDRGTESWVFPNLADTSGIRTGPSSQEPRPPLFVIGRIDFAQKGQDVLLNNFRTLVASGVTTPTLHFIGDGPDLDRLKVLARAFQSVKTHGWLERPILLPGDGVVALSSWFEGLPLIVLEAIDANLPVIASDTSGADQILPRECIYDMSDPQSFLSAYVHATNHRDAVVRHGRNVIARSYSRNRLQLACKDWLRQTPPTIGPLA